MPYFECPRCGGSESYTQTVQKWTTEYYYPDHKPHNSVSDELVYFCSACKTVQMTRYFTAAERALDHRRMKIIGLVIALVITIGFLNYFFTGRQSTFPWPPKKVSVLASNSDIKITNFKPSVNPDFLIYFQPNQECLIGVGSCAVVQYISRYKCAPVNIAVQFSSSSDTRTEIARAKDSDGTYGMEHDSSGYYVSAGRVEVDAEAANLDQADVVSIKCGN
jgi:hypothetical protein